MSYVPEVGAHAGPTPAELRTFIAAPAHVTIPVITHPTALYDLFIAYQEVDGDAAFARGAVTSRAAP